MPGAFLLTAVSSHMQKPEDAVMDVFHLAEGQSVHPSAHVNFNCPWHRASAGLGATAAFAEGDHSFADQILSLFSLTIVIMSPGLCFYQRCAGHVNCSDQKPEEVTTSMFVLQQISLPGKTFSHFFFVCVLMVAIPTLSIPEIISCGKDLIFLILIIFLVAVAIFCQ